MKYILPTISVLTLILTVSCTTANDVKDDAKKTPIGSVITGETTTADSYIRRVENENKKLDRDTWRPQTSERF